MKSRKHSKSIIALLLTVVMLMTVIAPLTASATLTVDTTKLGSDLYLTSQTDYTVAPGITEKHITTNNSEGSNQAQGYAIEVDLSDSTTGIIASYKDYDATTYGMQTVRDQAAAAEKKLGVNVVAGINADFYNMQTGAPTGTFVMTGVTYNTNSNRPWFAILNDGTAAIYSAGYTDTSNVKEAVGGNILLVKDGKITSSAANSTDSYSEQLPRTVVGIKADGSVVLYVVDGRQDPTSCGMSYKQLAYVMLALGCEIALNLDGGGSTTMISQHEGSEELVCRNSPSDGSERTVSSALLVTSSAVATGVYDHASLSPNNELYTVGSTVTFEATGVDSAGFAADLPSDGYFALEDSSCGTIDAATGVFTASEDYEGDVTVNYIVDGEVTGSTTISVVVPDELYLGSEEQAVGPGVITDFGIVAKYQDRDVVMKDGDLIWTITDQTTEEDLSGTAGTFDGLYFTAADDGEAYNVYVTATCALDEDLVVSITVFIGSKQVVLFDFEYTTDAEEAAADDSLSYIPSYTLPTFGSTYLSSIGYSNSSISQKLWNYVGDGTTEYDEDYEYDIYDYDRYPLYMWPSGAIDNDSVVAEVVSAEDGEPVRFGEHSLRISFDYSSYNYKANANFYLRTTEPRYVFDGSPTAIGCWVYVPEGTREYKIYLQCCAWADTGGYMAYGGVGSLDFTGWKYVELDLTGNTTHDLAYRLGSSYEPYGQYQGNGIFWISYQPGSMGYDTTADTIYIDHMTLIYGSNTSDTTNPTIDYIGDLDNEIVDGATVYSSNTVSLKAVYSDTEDKYMTGIDDEATKMYIDGVDVTDLCYINEGDDEIYFYDAYLANGVHSIEIEVQDVFGNNTTETRYFTVDGEDENTEVSLVAANTPVLGSDYEIQVITNNEDDVLSAEIKIKVLSSFTSYWQDVTVVPSDNYELDGDAVYNTIRDTLTFTVVRSEDASSENNTGVIATIVTAVPSDTPESLEVTHRIMTGSLTYASEKSDTYVQGFSGKIVSVCEAAFTLTTDPMVVDSDGGYIYVVDTQGNPAANATVYTSDGEEIGTTDDEGKVFTSLFVSSVASFEIYAIRGDERSFIYSSQSLTAGGSTDGMPTYVKLNAVDDSATMQSITWMSNPNAAGDDSIVLYATRADYEAYGDEAFTEFVGTSQIISMTSSGSITSNYAVRVNEALITGLSPDTEYAYIAGDGTNMSAVKYFSTTRAGTDVNFFVIGDTQATDTTNTALIAEQLANSGIDFDFGIQTGDAVDNGGNYTMWSNIAEVFSGDFLGEQDFIHVLGNHEYYGDANAANAAAYFDLIGTEDDGTAPLCYSVQYGNVYIAVFNYCATDSEYAEAIEWLAEDAANATASWKILTVHQPVYYTNPGGNTGYFIENLVPVIDEVGIDVVFSGHDHSYARTQPMTGGEVDTENGTVYYICGSTGEKSYDVVNNEDFNFATIDEDYNAVYLTATATDSTLTINTYDLLADGTVEIIETCTLTQTNECASSGHTYVIDDDGEWMTCSVCGYTTEYESTYTGFLSDTDGNLMYYIAGNAVTGWYAYGDDYYYFDENGYAITGTLKEDGHTYTFGDDFTLTKGSLEKQSDGTYCYYIAGTKQRGWFEIDGLTYFFNRYNSYKTCSGETTINDGTSVSLVYTFSDTGYLIEGAWYETEDGTQYFWGASPVSGLYEIGDDLYYFDPENNNYMVTGTVVIDGVAYTFAPDGKFAYYGTCVSRELVETVDATCTEDGYSLYEDTLDDGSVVDVYVIHDATGHTDEDGDYRCDVCGKNTINGFLAFLYRLIAFFKKIFNFLFSLFG